jgi:surfactin synthase thioesterase subunit
VTRALADLIHSDAGSRPFALFGHSVAALLAYETARVLRRVHHRSPLLLAVSALPPPHLDLDRVAVLPLLLDDAADVLAQVMRSARADSSRRSTASLCASLLADTVLALQYRHREEAPLDIPAAVYGGQDDPIAGKEQLGAWGDLFTEPVTPYLFPGDHMYPVEQVSALTARLVRDLHAAHRYSAS